MTPYERLPTVEGAYPPTKIPVVRRASLRGVLGGFLGATAVFVVLQLAIATLGTSPWSPQSAYTALPIPYVSISRNDTYLRDPYPIRTFLELWELAEREIEERRLDTCDDKLGRGLIEAYHRTRRDYVAPLDTAPAPDAESSVEGGGRGRASAISCTEIKSDTFSDWWPVPAAPCLSDGLRAHDGNLMRYHADLTAWGRQLLKNMGGERFVGTNLGEAGEGDTCDEPETHDRALIMIPRQDEWNPFHVAEDMITTMVSSLVAVRARPELASQPIQLVFTDNFGLEGNHFVPMWDRMGAWPPRRLSLDPWDRACLGIAIHSVGAGFSLLSAQGVGEAHHCASSITWAASHYYRNLFALRPRSFSGINSGSRGKGSVNVLWLSRAKFDRWAMKENKWTPWRDARHISNERDVVRRLQRGLAGMCPGSATECYVDENETPGYWSDMSLAALPLQGDSDDSRTPSPQIRFASMDPSVHSLETQVHLVGHTDILIGLHGGALGLSMFLHPGQAAVIELTVSETAGSRHFNTMSAQLGLGYEAMVTPKEVDVEDLWRRVEARVREML